MATRAGIDTSIVNRLTQDQQYAFFAVKAKFDTDTVHLWTGIDDIVINSETYSGAGSLLSVSGVEDSYDLKSNGLSISVSGMDTQVLDYALSENYQNRELTLFMGYVMGGSNEVAGVMTLFKGRMTNLTISDSADGATIAVNAENRLLDLKRPCNLRYTKSSQAYIDSNDTGFNRVNSIQDMEIVWGRAGNQGSAAAVGGGNNRWGNIHTHMR